MRKQFGVFLIPLLLCTSFLLPAPAADPTPATAPSTQSKSAAEIYTAWPFDAAEAARRQDQTTKALGIPKNISVDLAPGAPMKFILIPAGKYQDDSKKDLTVEKPFYMAQYKVTEVQYQKVTGKTVAIHPGGDYPMYTVKWADANDFCKKASELTKKKFALPTNLQWEFACRAGTNTRCYWGDDMSKLGLYCWYRENMGGVGHPVGKKLPNAFGLYDMMGLAWEWVSDGGPDAPKHDARGATWGSREVMFHSSVKWTAPDEGINDRFGMRVILELD